MGVPGAARKAEANLVEKTKLYPHFQLGFGGWLQISMKCSQRGPSPLLWVETKFHEKLSQEAKPPQAGRVREKLFISRSVINCCDNVPLVSAPFGVNKRLARARVLPAMR